MIPLHLCIVLVCIQAVLDSQVNNAVEYQCGCKCIDQTGDGKCGMICGVEYSSSGDQGAFYAIPKPQPWPPLILIPRPQARAVDSSFIDDSCRRKNTCPVTILFSGNNHSLGEVYYSSSGIFQIVLTKPDNFFF